jgi:hypothetical protein
MHAKTKRNFLHLSIAILISQFLLLCYLSSRAADKPVEQQLYYGEAPDL